MAYKKSIPFFLILIVLSAKNAYAYIDPNTGGYFFNSVLPYVAAGLGAIVVLWKRIVIFVKGLFSKKKNGDNSKGNE